MANKAPAQCPSCGERTGWKCTGESNKGFSVGKAAAGGLLLGPIGLVGGALGKRKRRITARTADSAKTTMRKG